MVVGINIAIALQFRKFQQALEEEFGDDIEIVGKWIALCILTCNVIPVPGWNSC